MGGWLARRLTQGTAGRLLVGVGPVEWESGGPKCLRTGRYRISRWALEGWEHLFRLSNLDVMV